MTVVVACTHARTSAAPAATTLKEAFAGAFLVGTAVSDSQASGLDTLGARLAVQQFNQISPENVLKWERVHPRPGVYDFEPSDRFVDFGARNGMVVIGHTLVWHSQVPAWVFQDADGKPLSRDSLIARMHDHITAVVGHYKGRIKGWDVVNEALEEDGSLRKTPWLRLIGEDYLAMAFRFAHDADPSAELYYNDYNLEKAAKRAGAVAMVKRLQAAGVPIAAVGSQTHDKMDFPSAAATDSTIVALAAAGVKVNISELDVDVLPPVVRGPTADVSARGTTSASSNPYAAGLPDSVQQALAKRYAELFRVFVARRDVIDRVTFWGVADGNSWLNNWPARGRTSHPLLFDRAGQPKPAFAPVLATARK